MDTETMMYIIGILLAVIGVFLFRLLSQIDQLIAIVAELKSTIIEHKGDVSVIKEQITFHAKEIDEMNKLWDRVRAVENEITGIKARTN